MTNRGRFFALLSVSALLPAGVFAQAPEESWFGALSIESGFVSNGSAQAATMFAAGAELQKPRIAGASLRIEVGGWRCDVLEGGARIARWDQSLGVSLTRSFRRADGAGRLTPSLATGLALHSIGHEDVSDAAAPHFRRTVHPGGFMDAALTLRLTRSDFLSLEARGRYAAIARTPDQTSLRLALRFRPGAGGRVTRSDAAPPPTLERQPGIAHALIGQRSSEGDTEAKQATSSANARPTLALSLPFSTFEVTNQLSRQKSGEISSAVRAFLRSHENASAEVVVFADADDVHNGSATMRAATVARILSGAGVRTDRLRITVRNARPESTDTGIIRIQLTR